MKHKRILITAFLISAALILPGVSSAVTVTSYYVDGVVNNSNVIIYNRQPVFTVEYTAKISTFTIHISTDSLFRSTTAIPRIWENVYGTSSVNTINLGNNKFRTYIAYGGAAPLALDTTYYWDMDMYYDVIPQSVSAPAAGEAPASFHTIVSSVSYAAPSANFDLLVDWNNPFTPGPGETGKTKFRYFVKEAERNALVRIFTISGDYVATAVHFAPAVGDYYKAFQGQTYTAEWDGKDYTGSVVPPGIYLVNLILEGEAKGVTRRVVVKKK